MKNTVQKQKRHLTGRWLSLLMLLFVFTGAVKADIVEIGDGTQTTNLYPTQATYNYCFNEMIYPAEAIGMAGNISQIGFHYKGDNVLSRNVVVYMKNVTRSAFVSTTDWESVSSSDIVYTGTLTSEAVDQWVTLTLDTPFAYDGTSNLMIALDDNSGTWSSRYWYYTNGADNCCMAYYNDNTNPDPYNPPTASGRHNTLPNLQLDITAGGVAGQLTVNDGTANNGYIPFYGLYADTQGSTSECIIPATDLADMAGGVISKMTFYLKTPAASSWTATWQVYLAEVDGTTLTGIVGPSAGTVVFEGALAATRTEMTITFDTPYTYNGGNLLIGSYVKSAGNYKSASFLGVATDGATAFYKFGSASYQQGSQSFLPKTTFDYFSTGGGTITATPSVLDLGDCPNGYSNEPATFELSTSGLDILTVTSMEVDNDYFQLDVEAPFTVSKNNPVTVNVTTGSGEPGVQNGQVTITYGESETVTVDLTANVYDVVSPDIWQLAEEVTDFPFHTVTETDNLYHNYNIPGGSAEGKDAVYKVTFTEDVLLSAGNNGDNAATMIYPEYFNGEVGPGLDNYYYYDGPQVNPGPVNLWFSYDYTGTNTYFGSNANNGYYAGYKIPAAKIDELGLADCSFVAVETAAYESYPYDLYIFRGGNTPFDGELIYSKLMDHNPVARNFFDVYIDEPFLVGTEDLWVIFYSESRYMMYCGKNPGDTENGKVWAYNLNAESPAWNGYDAYTPVIYCWFIELPTGRTVTINPANMEIKSNPNAVAGEVGEMAGVANGVSKAQHYMEAMARNNRGNRDTQTLIEEGFEESFMPEGWTQEGDGVWYVGNGDYSASTGSANGDYNALIVHSTLNAVTYLITPEMDLSNATSATVSCNYINRSWNGDRDYFGIYYRVDGGAWNELFATTETHATWTSTGDIELTGLAANYQIGFRHSDNYGYGLGIDDVVVTAEMGAPTPSQPHGPVYQISDMFVTAGTYYIVTASTKEDFEFDMAVADIPAPMQAEVVNPVESETDVESPYYAQWVLGYYTKEMQVLYGTTNPPTTVLVDWTDNLVESAFIPSLDNNRSYYFQVNERNETGETEGAIVPFTTKIEPVTGFAAVTPYIYVGDVAELTWNAIQDEEFLGYDIYSTNGKLNDELITETSYLIEGLDYNPTGYYFYVKAVYEAGESGLRSTQVYVSGNGVVDGHVYEQDGETPIAGVNVYFYGYDNFGVYGTFNAVTDEEGHYNIELAEGVYESYWTVKPGYQSVYNNEIINLAYQETVEGVDFILDEMFYGVDYVEATEELPAPKVLWSNGGQHGDRSFQNYRVYRTTFDNEGPFNVNNTVLIAEVVNDTVIYDETFAELEEGLYKYGVSCVYEGNRDGALNEFTETFDEGLPETWSMIDADGDGRCWMLGSQASLGYGHGHNGSNDMMISKSFENGSGLYPNNYLVTPQVQFGTQSRFEFYACAQDANYPEHVGVAVSTAGNQYTAEFTTIAQWQVDNERTQGIWHKYIVELDQYAGQTGYIAIRHFNSSYNFYLDIDDASFYNVDVQLPRESAITWSNLVGKGMYLTDGAVNMTVTLTSGDAPEGIVATFQNQTQPEIEDVVVNLDENGYYAFDSFRKGYYKVILEKSGYEILEEYVEIWEPVSLEYMMFEEFKSPTDFTVSSSGYASWQAPQTNGRHFENRYYLSIYDESGNYICGEETTDNFVYLNEDNFSDGVMYQANVVAYYSTQDESTVYSSDPAICYWTYKACNHYLGANNLTVKPLEEGAYMRWDYPGVDEERGVRDSWDLLTSFNATSGYQYGICTDGTNIYTSSWSANSSSMFYKYDKDGNLIEEFNIDGCGQLRDLTYDGQFFYGVANSSTVYCVDFNTKTLISTFESAYGTMRCITYDPERNGFWVVGNWGGDLTLINRYGNIVFTGPTPSNVSGVAYYKDSEGVEHVLMPDNNAGVVYDYDIATNTISDESVCNLMEMLPGYTGTTGGCHVGIYNNKMAFFADVQQSPQLIGIFELGEATVETPLGARIYVNDDYVGFTEDNEWMFEGYNEDNTFSLRLVYEGNRLSCMQDAYLLKKYWIESYVNNGEGGSVTESAYYFEGDTCVLTATPSEDYDFYCWDNYYTSQVASYEPTFSFVVRGYGSYGASFITDYYWNDVNLYENNMNVIGLIKVDDEIFDANEYTPLYEIGAFCGDECRGHQRLHYYPEVDSYLVYLTINGNEGDNINFLISYLGVEQNYMCTSPIVFEADAALGTSFEPYELTFYRSQKIEQYDEFNTGWNWWSTYIEQDNMFNGLQSLQTDLASTGYMISSQTAYTMNYGAYGWYGSLNKINNESMYKIKMNEPSYSYMYYYYSRTDFHPITIVPGWNYIGYPAHFWMSLDEALIGLKPSNGDMIKSQYEYANYYEGYGWFGSLNYLNPGMGYMYKSTSADTLTFVYGQDTSADTLYRQETGILTVEKRIRENNNHWVSNANVYRDNMTVMAVVNLDGVELSSDNYELAAFVDGECRGSVRLAYAEPLNRYVAFLTVAGEETATVGFGLYDVTTGNECYSDDIVEFNSDIMVGNPGNPVVISFNGMGDSGFMVYPNPVAKGERVNIVLPNGSKRVHVEVLNSLGEVVSVETLTQSQASIALPQVPGVYTVRIITDNKDTNFKKVIVK